MSDKKMMKFLASVYIVGGVVTLVLPESMGKLIRWFADNPRYMRLVAVLDIALGIWLIKQQYQQEEAPPQPRYRRLLRS